MGELIRRRRRMVVQLTNYPASRSAVGNTFIGAVESAADFFHSVRTVLTFQRIEWLFACSMLRALP